MRRIIRETPEEFEARTSKPWNDHSPVYMRVAKNGWCIMVYWEAKQFAEWCRIDKIPFQMHCANSDAGIPKRNLNAKRV
jgi:hypothetical protein